jgi:hypothetical protein
MRGITVLLCLVVLAAPSRVFGQIEGRVIDDSGRPFAPVALPSVSPPSNSWAASPPSFPYPESIATDTTASSPQMRP